jgi:hypothetical protein
MGASHKRAVVSRGDPVTLILQLDTDDRELTFLELPAPVTAGAVWGAIHKSLTRRLTRQDIARVQRQGVPVGASKRVGDLLKREYVFCQFGKTWTRGKWTVEFMKLL